MIKVLIVDDSPFIQKVLRQMLSFDPEIEVIGEASNGREAITKIIELKPDVVCLDIMMPQPDGLATIERINRLCPTPIIVFSAISAMSSEITAEALRLGVIDVVQKPQQHESIRVIRGELLNKLKSAARVDTVKLKEFYSSLNTARKIEDRVPQAVISTRVVAIGSSAGGPPALYKLVSSFPSDLNAGVLVGQHLPPHFVAGMAAHMKKFVPFPVKVADDGDIVALGRILISPADTTMCVSKIKHGGVVHLSNIECEMKTRPCINGMFKSVAECYGRNAIGIVLSGMGNDGTEGLRAIKAAGGITFAQDEATSLVYGMPQAAAKAGVVDYIMSVEEIAKEVSALLNMRKIESMGKDNNE